MSNSSERPHPNSSNETVNSEEHRQFFIEGEPLEGQTRELIPTENLLSNYKDGNEDIRESLSPQLSTTGLLLTLALGAWYFVLKDSTGLPIRAPQFIPWLFLLTLLLILSISSGIESINQRTTPLAISKVEELQYIVKIHKSKRMWSRCSIWSLRIAFAIILCILIFFTWQCYHMNPGAEDKNPYNETAARNSTAVQLMPITPTNLSNSDKFGLTHRANSDNRTKFQA